MLRRLSYNPIVRQSIKACGLQSLAQTLYYHYVAPRNGRINICCCDVEASFSAVDSGELRRVEAAAVTEQNTMESLLGRLAPGDCFLDVGSEFGVYAILAAKLIGQAGCAIAIEPYPQAYAILTKNIEMNRLRNVAHFPVALGSSESLTGIADQRDGAVCCATLSGAGTIPVIRGDELIRRNRLPMPAVVKMDIEGYEYAALEGLRTTLSAPSCRVLCCEIHPGLLPGGIAPEAVLALIREFGFTEIHTAVRGTEIHALAEKH